MSLRYYIQHIGGDPIALRYAEHDTLREVDGAWVAEWTTDPEKRAEWMVSTEAHTAREQLGVGIVLHTDYEHPSPDEEARLAERKPRAEPAPEIIRTSEPPPPPDRWWDR